MGSSIRTGNKHKTFDSSNHKFNKYNDGFTNLNGRTIRVKGKDGKEKEIDAGKGLSNLIDAYGKLGCYKKLRGSDYRQKLSAVLNCEGVKKKYPFKRLLFKFKKFRIEFANKIRVSIGKLKTPESTPPVIPSTPSEKPAPIVKPADPSKLDPAPHENVFHELLLLRLGLTPENSSFVQDGKQVRLKPIDEKRVLMIIEPNVEIELSYIFRCVEFRNPLTDEIYARIPTADLVRSDLISVVNKHINLDSTLTIFDLLKKLGIHDNPIKKVDEDGIEYSIRRSTSNPSAVTVELSKNGSQISVHRVRIQKGEVLVTKVTKVNEIIIEKMSLEEVSIEKILEIVKKKPVQATFKSNSDMLLNKLGSSNDCILTTLNGINCFFQKSHSRDQLLVETDNLKSRGGIFKLGVLNNKVYLQQLFYDRDKIVYVTDIEKLTLQEILNEVVDRCGIKNGKDSSETVAARMIASVTWKEDDYYLNAERKGLDLKKLLRDQSPKALKAFMDFYDPSCKIVYNLKMSVPELIKAIQDSKIEGLHPKETYVALNQLLTKYLKEKALNPEDKKLFETLLKRIREKFSFEWGCREVLEIFIQKSSKHAETMAEHEALKILLKAYSPEYQDIGVFVTAGWKTHHVNLEVRKVKNHFGKDVYEIVVGNAGAASENNRAAYELDLDGNPQQKKREEKLFGITTKVYQADEEQAVQILKNAILFKYKDHGSAPSISRDFNKIFEKATVVENYSIPDRAFQTLGNCGPKSNLEAIFAIAQRLSKIDAMNDFVEFINSELADFADEINYGAFKESLEPKPKVEPLDKGNSTFILQESSSLVHLFPNGKKARAFTVGLRGDVQLKPTSGGMSRQQAILVNEKENYYLQRHPKGNKANRVTILREGKQISVGFDKVEIKSGDIVCVGDVQMKANFSGKIN